MHISSLQNDRVKEITRLRKRSHRDAGGVILVEGSRELQRALENGHIPTELVYCAELLPGKLEEKLVEQALARGGRAITCTKEVFGKLAHPGRAEGFIALIRQFHRLPEELDLPASPLLVVAESVEKPGNLGSILRSADGAGVHGLIVCDACTDLFNPNTVRNSMGTLFSVPVAEAPSNRTLAWLKERGIHILATSPQADTVYTDADLCRATAVVVGAEASGLSSTWMDAADTRVRIPMLGQADSLNVANATTLLLYEAVRQRNAHRSQGAV